MLQWASTHAIFPLSPKSRRTLKTTPLISFGHLIVERSLRSQSSYSMFRYIAMLRLHITILSGCPDYRNVQPGHPNWMVQVGTTAQNQRPKNIPKHSMGLAYFPTLTPKATPMYVNMPVPWVVSGIGTQLKIAAHHPRQALALKPKPLLEAVGHPWNRTPSRIAQPKKGKMTGTKMNLIDPQKKAHTKKTSRAEPLHQFGELLQVDRSVASTEHRGGPCRAVRGQCVGVRMEPTTNMFP